MAGNRINIEVKKKTTLSGSPEIPTEGLYGPVRFGFYGMITEVHPEDNTVHVRMDSGRELSGVRVASLEWVTIDDDKGFLSGEWRPPPVNTFVFCLMPSGEPSSAFVLCSMVGRQVAEHSAFKEKSEDAKYIKKQVDNSGWTRSIDYRTGTRTIQNKPKDETIKLEINQEESGKEKVILTIYSHIITFDEEEGISIETDGDISKLAKGEVELTMESNVSVTVKGNAEVSIEGDVSVQSKGNANISTEGDVSVTSKGNTDISADGNVSITSKGKANVSTDGDISVQSKGNAEVSADGDVSIQSSRSGTIKIGNMIATLGKIISDLLQALVSFKSLGSPASHTAPELTITATQLKAQWDQVFK
jgi:hypothetical protein